MNKVWRLYTWYILLLEMVVDQLPIFYSCQYVCYTENYPLICTNARGASISYLYTVYATGVENTVSIKQRYQIHSYGTPDFWGHLITFFAWFESLRSRVGACMLWYVLLLSTRGRSLCRRGYHVVQNELLMIRFKVTNQNKYGIINPSLR